MSPQFVKGAVSWYFSRKSYPNLRFLVGDNFVLFVGLIEGIVEGVDVGFFVRLYVGIFVGLLVGRQVGFIVGRERGESVGKCVVFWVTENVDNWLSSLHLPAQVEAQFIKAFDEWSVQVLLICDTLRLESQLHVREPFL